MPVVPMFHAMAWGIPYIAAMVGARQVLPGTRPDPRAAGRPDRRRGRHLERRRADDLERHARARSAPRPVQPARAQGGRRPRCPESLIRGFDERFGDPARPGLGNDGDEPACGHVEAARGDVELSDDEAYALRACQGRVLPLIEFRIDADSGRRAPGPRPVDRARLLRGPGLGTRSSPRTAGCAPATSPSSSATPTSSSSTAPRTWSSPAASGSPRSSSRTPSWPTRTSSRPP